MCVVFMGMVMVSWPSANQATSSPKLRPCTRLLRRIGGRVVRVNTHFPCARFGRETLSLQTPTIRGQHCLAESLRNSRVAVDRLHPQLQAPMRRCRDGDRGPNLRVLLRSFLRASAARVQRGHRVWLLRALPAGGRLHRVVFGDVLLEANIDVQQSRVVECDSSPT